MQKIPILLLFTILPWICPPVHAQSFTARIEHAADWVGKGFPKIHRISFNESGEMIAFPKAVIREHDMLIFSVRVSKSSLIGKINKLFEKMDAAYSFFKDTPTNQQILWTLFKDQDNIQQWIGQLDIYRLFRQSLLIKNAPGTIEALMDTSSKKVDSIRLMSLFPVREYIDNIKKIFSIKMIYGCDSVTKEVAMHLFAKTGRTENDSCYWWYSDTLYGKDFFRMKCGNQYNTLSFNLMAQDPMRATLVEWYDRYIPSTKDSLAMLQDLQKRTITIVKTLQQQKILDTSWDSSTWLSTFSFELSDQGILSAYTHMFDTPDSLKGPDLQLQRIDSMLKVKIGHNPYKPDNAGDLKEKMQEIQDLTAYVSRIRSLQRWLVAWLWYNKGYLVINPFPLHPDSLVKAGNDNLDSLNKELKIESARKTFLDSAQKNLPAAFRNYDTLLKIQDTLANVSTRIDSLNKKIKRLQQSQTTYMTIRDDTTTMFRNYAGILPFSLKKRHSIQKGLDPGKQFSYSGREKAIYEVYHNGRERERTTEVPENENVVLLLHNVPKNAKVNITKVQSAFDDMEEFTLLFNRLLKKLDSTGLLQAAIAPGLGNLVNLLKAFKFFDQPDHEAAMKAHSLILQDYPGIPPIVTNYLAVSAKNSVVKLDTQMIIRPAFKKGVDLTGGYLTIYNKVDKSEGAHQIDISLAVDTVKGKGTLKVGGLHAFQLLAGIAFTHDPVMQTSVDTAGNGFKTSYSSNNVQTIIGVKLYPARTYLRDRSILPRYPFRRLSLDLSVSIPKILNNFYIAGGYDVVPGLTFSVGGNFSRINYYQVQNAQIINSAVRYKYTGTFYGVSINPVIFVQFIKLFFN